MPYVVQGTRQKAYTVKVTKSKTVFTGFEDITIARPIFLYFKCTGLRPNTRHFFFFDNTNVTNYINTDSVVAADYYNLSRNDPRRTPGDTYLHATGFPNGLGGPTSEIYSDDTGTIEGVFYLQSNDTINFPAGTRVLTAIDISVLNLDDAISVSQQQFIIDGGIENYNTEYYTVSETRYKTVPNRVWVDPEPDPSDFVEPVDPVVCFMKPNDENYSPRYVIDDGILGNRNDSVVDEAIVGAVVGGIVSGTVAGAVGGSIIGVVLAICCFIMLEARYGDGTMDNVVRRYRDEKMTDRNRRGYYKVAEVFVPLMRSSPLFKWIITKTFADPLVSYGKWYYGENKHGWIFKPVEKFWMWTFNTVGGDVEFIRENGEVV